MPRRKQVIKTGNETSSDKSPPVSSRLRSASKKGTHNDDITKSISEKGLIKAKHASTEKTIPEEPSNSESVLEEVGGTTENRASIPTTTKEVDDSELQEVSKEALGEVIEQEKTTGGMPRLETSDDEAAPEEVSMKTSKAQELDAQKRKRAIEKRLTEEKKQKLRELDRKYKEQKNRKLKKEMKDVQAGSSSGNLLDSIKKRELPTFLPDRVLEDLAVEERIIDERKNVSVSDEVVEETNRKNVEPPRKKKKKHHDTGPFTVVVMDHNEPKFVGKGVVEFRKNHFYGGRLPRRNAILNASQTRNGAALRFRRR
ncbi:8930_t:CDS:2 [Acaulospora morrowiae]|uniref:8930_t:CDS:1 n=1 Tax=Acaulospora morrowiae TaxID=94023 RepID=A0A9N9ARM7_9GLOM|nr:8930_t:CDS:2 [Acaulospora morrowiae]